MGCKMKQAARRVVELIVELERRREIILLGTDSSEGSRVHRVRRGGREIEGGECSTRTLPSGSRRETKYLLGILEGTSRYQFRRWGRGGGRGDRDRGVLTGGGGEGERDVNLKGFTSQCCCWWLRVVVEGSGFREECCGGGGSEFGTNSRSSRKLSLPKGGGGEGRFRDELRRNPVGASKGERI
jgi:hypothetical protein